MKRNFEVEKKIVEEYSLGVNNKQLCEKYNKSRSYIQQVLLRHNIKLRKGSEITKKYNINENYFENIDDNNKAYILGLIFADGNLYKNTVRLNLIETDSHILYDISSKIYFDDNYQISILKGRFKLWNNISYYTKQQKVLVFTRKKIGDDLKKHGLLEKKSLIIRFPSIDDKYYKDFIRGYFDGDGCFYTSTKYKNNNRIQIISNEIFINSLKKIIETKLNISCIIKKNKIEKIFRLNIYGNIKVKKFLDWIYDKSDLKLNRKYQHYINNYK